MRRTGTVAAMAVLLLAGCAEEGPEARIGKAFDACAQGVREGDVPAIMSRVSARFQGPEGLNGSEVPFYLMRLFKDQKVGVTVFSHRIELQGPAIAFQTADVLVTGRNGQSLWPDATSRMTISLRWEKSQGKWVIKELRDITPMG